MKEVTITKTLEGKEGISVVLNDFCEGRGFISDLWLTFHYPLEIAGEPIEHILLLKEGKEKEVYMDVHNGNILLLWGMLKYSYGHIGPLGANEDRMTLTVPSIVSYTKRAVLPLDEKWRLEIRWQESEIDKVELLMQTALFGEGETIYDFLPQGPSIPRMTHDTVEGNGTIEYPLPVGGTLLETMIFSKGEKAPGDVIISGREKFLKAPWIYLAVLTRREFDFYMEDVVMLPWNKIPLWWDDSFSPIWRRGEGLDLTYTKAGDVTIKIEGCKGPIHFLNVRIPYN